MHEQPGLTCNDHHFLCRCCLGGFVADIGSLCFAHIVGLQKLHRQLSFALNSGHIFYAFILLKTWTHLSKLNVEAGSMGCISDQVYRLLIQSNQKGGPYLIEECKHSYQWIPQQCSSAGLVQKSKITHFFQILCIFEILQTDFLQTTTINMWH